MRKKKTRKNQRGSTEALRGHALLLLLFIFILFLWLNGNTNPHGYAPKSSEKPSEKSGGYYNCQHVNATRILLAVVIN